jgi:hypothetical protein
MHLHSLHKKTKSFVRAVAFVCVHALAVKYRSMISAGRVLANSSFRLKIGGLSAYPTKKG